MQAYTYDSGGSIGATMGAIAPQEGHKNIFQRKWK